MRFHFPEKFVDLLCMFVVHLTSTTFFFKCVFLLAWLFILGIDQVYIIVCVCVCNSFIPKYSEFVVRFFFFFFLGFPRAIRSGEFFCTVFPIFLDLPLFTAWINIHLSYVFFPIHHFFWTAQNNLCL